MPPPGKGSYFLALIPPSPAYEEALGWKIYFKDQFQCKASLNSPPHLTLHMPFEWKESKERVLINSLETFAKSKNEFSLELNGFGSFPPRVIFINVDENESLNELQNALHQFVKSELNLFNAQYRDLPFHPHLTVAFRDLKKAHFAKAWEEFKDKPFQATFRVNELVLLKHNGRIWEPFRQFPFMQLTKN